LQVFSYSAAARRRRGAGHELKDGSVRQRMVGLRRGLKLTTDRVVARGKITMAQRGQRAHGSGLCLRGIGASFTIKA